MQFDAGSKNLATAGTAIQFKAVVRKVKAITFHARSTNTGQVFVGGSDVTATNGYELSAFQAVSLTFNEGSDSLTDFYMNASSTTQTCDFLAVYE